MMLTAGKAFLRHFSKKSKKEDCQYPGPDLKSNSKIPFVKWRAVETYAKGFFKNFLDLAKKKH